MDIEGAKALRNRLGADEEAEAYSAREDVEVREDAPPVFQWLGLTPPKRDALPAHADEEPAVRTASFLSRLGLNFR